MRSITRQCDKHTQFKRSERSGGLVYTRDSVHTGAVWHAVKVYEFWKTIHKYASLTKCNASEGAGPDYGVLWPQNILCSAFYGVV